MDNMEQKEKKKVIISQIVTTLTGCALAVVLYTMIQNGAPDTGMQHAQNGNTGAQTQETLTQESDPALDEELNQLMAETMQTLMIGSYTAKEDETLAFGFYADGTYSGYVSPEQTSATGAEYRVTYQDGTHTLIITGPDTSQTMFSVSYDQKSRLVLANETISYTLISQ